MSSIAALTRPGGFHSVVVVTGHVTDGPDRDEPRFPESEVPRVRREIMALLDEWSIGPDDLVLCGGARGADILGALGAHERGATVWILLARSPEDFERSSVEGADPAWVERYRWLLARVPSWQLDDDPRFAGRRDRYAAANEWMLDAAAHQCGRERRLRLVAVWDGLDAGRTGGTNEMVALARARGAAISVIDPRPADRRR